MEIKYRCWNKGIPPRPTKLEIPGWAGDLNNHGDGDAPQPWHCIPWVEGATYPLELAYSFDTECQVSIVDGKIKFAGDFSLEQAGCPEIILPPFMSFAPGHFGMTSSLDIKVPSGYVLRTEPHPRYYTDTTYTVPCCLPGHIQTEWWPKIFFVVFKNPMPGQTLIFRKGEPYGQVLVVPKKVSYDIKEMTVAEATQRATTDDKLNKYCKRFVNNDWHDHLGHNFDDKYKMLSAIFSKNGTQGVQEFIDAVANKIENKKKFCGKLLMKRKDEGIQDKEEKP